ncbi:MAG: YggS family pyridoxal phosphate-dependent enzyme, partial [Clostridiales bacterium]|nr:YggS family pyridoxal phosphate-dependent enzyme [Clostridiales bacterium]
MEFALIEKNIAEIRGRIAAAAERAGRDAGAVTLLAATKTRTPQEMAAAVFAGVADLGENRVQEYEAKIGEVQHLVQTGENSQKKPNIKWHFIGHFQRNKVKYIAKSVDLIHSVDRLELVEEIHARAAQENRRISVLIEVNPAGETQKSGVPPGDAERLALTVAEKFSGIEVAGLMAVVPIAEDSEEVRPWFRQMRRLFEEISGRRGRGGDGSLPAFAELSMGMTQDYEVAVEEGATIVRV